VYESKVLNTTTRKPDHYGLRVWYPVPVRDGLLALMPPCNQSSEPEHQADCQCTGVVDCWRDG